MRNKSEAQQGEMQLAESAGAIPPGFEWKTVCKQLQLWRGGCVFSWRHDGTLGDLEHMVERAWVSWVSYSGITRERYEYLLGLEAKKETRHQFHTSHWKQYVKKTYFVKQSW